jgi:two-component system OmpR family sensor kinase/two-component system sensor histidine kinase QseC
MAAGSLLNSIRARLLLGLMVLVALTSITAGVITYRRVLDETSRLFDYQLRQMALSLRDQAATGPGIVLPSHPDDSDFVIQIWDLFGAQVYRSRPELPLINRAVLGYADMPLVGQRWRVYSLATVDAVIQVAQPWRVREQLARAAALRILVRLLLLLLAMAAAVVWIVGRGLAPLRRLAAEVERRDVHTLEPIAAPELPREAAPLVEELNRLLARLGEAFRRQRAFVADAAHELRSPLTALSLQLQLLDRAQDETARREQRAKLGEAIERATHLAGQLLTLARSEPEGAPAPLRALSLAESARAGMADVSTLAAERGIELTLDDPNSVTVMGDADALRILVRNLVDNAVRHSPRGGRVGVRISASGGGEHNVVLTVEDTGPGIPVDERERVFDRFHRRADAAEGGSGLGLAIVKAIADRHGAVVSLGDSIPHGLTATVSFPQATS